jgi:spermidine synthase
MPKRMKTPKSYKNLKLMILVFFFLSGLSGLTYEILWTRLLVKIVGGAPFAISMVLTIFMAGFGLGGDLAGRIIDTVDKPLKLVKIYGILELIIGGYALIIPLLLIAFKPAYAYLYNFLFQHFLFFNFLTFIGCAIILAVPVICMGATLPILCRFYVARLSALGTHAGRLYGFNTIGAAAGSLLCGFWLLELLGNNGTLALAVSINALIGLACLLIGSGESIKTKKKKAVEPENGISDQSVVYTDRSIIAGALVIFAVSGFSSMACEVIWAKLLGIIVGPTTYSFTIVLVTFISGLALGSIFFGWLADRIGRTIQLLIITQIVAALLILIISQLLGNSQLFFARLIAVNQNDFTMLSISKASVLLCLMIIPTLCLGATFPLVGKIYTQSLTRVGQSIGYAYAVNTIGAVLGSFCAGFILIPFVGKEMGIRFIVGLQLLTALAVMIIILIKTRYLNKKWALLTVPVLFGFFLSLYYPSWDRQLLGKGIYYRFPMPVSELINYGWLQTLFDGSSILSNFEQSELVYYGDGAGGITTVMKETDAIGSDIFVMLNSGKVDASTRGDMKTQTLLAHIPMLFHRDARNAMVVGLASGVTTGEILHYPVDRVDILEISKEVVTGSDYFLPWNNKTLSDPRTNLIIQDGRAHLELTSQKYDVIISEPSNPWMAGMATLFTEEFFELARNRLTENGIFVQFTHSYQMNWETFSLIGRTFASVFPNSVLMNTDPSNNGFDFILLGFLGQGGLNLDNALNNIQYLQKSTNITLSDPRILYRQIMSEDFNFLFGRGSVNTDNFPILEFAAPRIMHKYDPQIQNKIQTFKRRRASTDSIAAYATENIESQINFTEYALSLYTHYRGMVDLSNADRSQKSRYAELLNDFCREKLISSSMIDDVELRDMCRDLQIESILSNIDRTADRSVAFFHLASIFFDQGDFQSSMNYYQKGLQENPNSAGGHYNLGKTFERLNDVAKASEHYKLALDIRPYMAETHAAYGRLLVRSGSLPDAVKHLSDAIRLDPDRVEAYVNLSVAYMQMNRLDKARSHIEAAITIRPDFAEAHHIYGKILSQLNRQKDAIKHFSTAITLKPEFARAHYDLGILFLQQQIWDNAITCFKNTLTIAPNLAGAHLNLGKALTKMNDLNAANHHFEEALRLDPESVAAREGLESIRQLRSGN